MCLLRLEEVPLVPYCGNLVLGLDYPGSIGESGSSVLRVVLLASCIQPTGSSAWPVGGNCVWRSRTHCILIARIATQWRANPGNGNYGNLYIRRRISGDFRKFFRYRSHAIDVTSSRRSLGA